MQEFDFVHLGDEDVPEWFTLDLIQGVDPTVLPLSFPPVPLLIVGIAERTLLQLVDILPKYSWLDGCQKRLGEYDIMANFLLDIDKPWGFRGVLNPYQRPAMLEFASMPFPFLRSKRMPVNAKTARVQVRPKMVGIASTAIRQVGKR